MEIIIFWGRLTARVNNIYSVEGLPCKLDGAVDYMRAIERGSEVCHQGYTQDFLMPKFILILFHII